MNSTNSILAMTLLLYASCSGVTPFSKSKKEATTEQPTEQPTEVAGGFGLTMQCSLVNRDVPNATSSQIACLVNNDDGTRYTGSMQNLKARVHSKSANSGVDATPVVNSSNSASSISVVVNDVKPQDATSIEISGSFDNKQEKLSSSLLSRFALVCDEDLNLSVDSRASADNLYCTAEHPCATISQAIALLQETINCNVKISVGSGRYRESLTIRNVSIMRGHKLLITGPDFVLSDGPSVDLDPPNDCGTAEQCAGIHISGVESSAATVEISNISVNGNRFSSCRTKNTQNVFSNGALVTGASTIVLNNLWIENTDVGIYANMNSKVTFSGRIANSSAGISATNSSIYAKDSVKINPIPENAVGCSQLGNGNGIDLNASQLSVIGELFIGKSSSAIALDRSSTLSMSDAGFNLLSISNPLYGISLSSGSSVVGIQSRDVRKGRGPNNTDPPEPKLQITDCGRYCILMSGRSYLNLGASDQTSDRNFFTLELRGGLSPDPAPATGSLIYESDYSSAYLDFIKNIWCDQTANTNVGLSSQASISVNSGASFYLKRDKAQAKAFATCTAASEPPKTVNNFQIFQEPLVSPCRPGFYSFTPSGATSDVCLGNIGFTQITEYDRVDPNNVTTKISQPLLIDQIDDKM